MEDEDVMKACQRGFGNYKGALDDANNLLAECYGTIGKLSIELNAARAAMEAAKKSKGWDSIPCELHKNLDELFKALSPAQN